MRQDNIEMLEDTLSILKKGFYTVKGKKTALKLSPDEQREALVFLPADVERISAAKDFPHIHVLGRCGYTCVNVDSFGMARKRTAEDSFDLKKEGAKPVLVLNFANPVNPGGGARKGSQAQEEDLCRKSSLLLSLESRNAAAYYEYNRSLGTYMGSDAVIIHPQVEIIKDENGGLLPDSVVVAVMTCAAPMLRYGLSGMTREQYEELFYSRITGMLKVAAYLGYKRLVLGAFGCGAFGNDARVVSDVFYKALKEFDFDGMKESDMFERIDFAVLDRTRDLYNFKEFCRNFSHFYRDEDQRSTDAAAARKKERKKNLDRIRGCIYGGAVGDALGYPVEFLGEEKIFSKYGPKGITSFEYDKATGKALISDDTQMTLFTANGILVGDTRISLRGIGGPPSMYVRTAYEDWLATQNSTAPGRGGGESWLMDVPELYARRAPGITCLSALSEGAGSGDYEEEKINDSKGCGGVMRVAPLALYYDTADIEELDREGARLAAITHGHSLGYMPAAVLVHILNRIVFPPESGRMTLRQIVSEASAAASKIFKGDPNLTKLTDIISLAARLSENGEDDRRNIRRLGEGWVAEETLAIALYCALRHADDFSAGVTAAVNHGGDSDSTGSVAGNILGALLGYGAIEEKWKRDLEISDVILEIADDLCYGCQMSEFGSYRDPEWLEKYAHMRRPQKNKPVFFWKADEAYGCFSNWYARGFTVDGISYLHVEQYMMAGKARLCGDEERLSAVLRAKSPSECKRLGRSVTPFDAEAWDKAKYDIVKTGARAKFAQNADLKAVLMSTGDALIAEASPKDKIWGIGIGAAEAAERAPSDWPGENLLGKVLMELRDEFKGA
ncbi:MAG: TIGR02452 family protein [Clostridia bacterium]|nr:TIGR02452 family protein [Clostridia bacterium]